MSRRSLVAAAAFATGAARAECALAPHAVVPLRVVEGFPVVGARIGAAPVTFVLDTGAQAHLIVPEAQAALALRVLPGSVPVFGTGGATAAPLVLLDDVHLGAVRLDPAPTPVASLPALPRVTPRLVGLLGAPLLLAYDLDLDAASGRLALFEPGGCDGAVPQLAPAMTAIRLVLTPEREALLPVRINGVELVALLDTGARATLLGAAAADRLGLRAPASANTSAGVDGQRLPVAHLRVREMAVGADVRRDAPVSIAPLQLGRADMLLGFDYLRLRRVWISYATSRVVIGVPSPGASGR